MIAMGLLLALPAAGPGSPGRDDGHRPQATALVLHARALAAEQDGDLEQALELLRVARRHAPDDRAVAFTLARIALQSDHESLGEDTVPFMALAAARVDEHLLRAYVHLAMGEDDDAAAALQHAIDLDPEHAEAHELRAELSAVSSASLIAPGGTGAESDAIRFAVRARTEVDSNVTVLPESTPSRQGGARMQVDAGLDATPLDGTLRLDTTLLLQTAHHLTNREALAAYDAAVVSGTAALSVEADPACAELFVTGSVAWLDSFAETFAREVAVGFEGSFVGPWLQAGVMSSASQRDFVLDSEEGSLDRDGPRLEAALVLASALGPVDVHATAGWQQERARGTEYKEQGVFGRAYAVWAAQPFRVQADVGYEDRDHTESSTARHDRRVQADASVLYALSDRVAVAAGYSLTRNVSDEEFQYSRHIGHVGLEAQW